MNNACSFCDTCGIEELNHESALKFVPIDWMVNNSRLIVEDEANQHYVVTQGRSDGIFQKQDSNEDYGRSAFQAYLGSGATALKYPSNASRKRSREKAFTADRNRRSKISQRLDAWQYMFPHFKEGCKEDLVDYVVDQVKYLQYQVKDLCQSKLGGEPSSSSSIFLEVKLYESMGMPDMQASINYHSRQLDEVGKKCITPARINEVQQSDCAQICTSTTPMSFFEDA